MAERRAMVNVAGILKNLPDGDYANIGKFNMGSAGEVLTVTSTSVTLSGNTSWIIVDASSAQTLHTLNGGDVGDIIVLNGEVGSSDITVEKGTGNIFGGTDRILNQGADCIFLFKRGTNWVEIVSNV